MRTESQLAEIREKTEARSGRTAHTDNDGEHKTQEQARKQWESVQG